MYDRWEEDVSRKNQSLSKIWIEEEKLERGSRAGENESIASADRSGGGEGRAAFPSVGVSSENGVVRRVSSAILRQFQDESADPLPQAPATNPCFLNPRDGFPSSSIDPHSPRGAEGRPKYHRTAATGCFSREYYGEEGGGGGGKKCRETAASP